MHRHNQMKKSQWIYIYPIETQPAMAAGVDWYSKKNYYYAFRWCSRVYLLHVVCVSMYSRAKQTIRLRKHTNTYTQARASMLYPSVSYRMASHPSQYMHTVPHILTHLIWNFQNGCQAIFRYQFSTRVK